MATTAGGKQCSCFYCGRPANIGGHYPGCPVLDPSGRAMDEWNRGYDYGFDDHNIPPYRRGYRSQAFITGWAKGFAEIDRLAQVAFYLNYGYEYTEEEWDDFVG